MQPPCADIFTGNMGGPGNVILRLQVLPANIMEISTLTGTGSHGVGWHPRLEPCASLQLSLTWGPQEQVLNVLTCIGPGLPGLHAHAVLLLEHNPTPALTHSSSRTSCSTHLLFSMSHTGLSALGLTVSLYLSGPSPSGCLLLGEAGNMNSLDPQHPQKELMLNKHDGGISKLESLWKEPCPRMSETWDLFLVPPARWCHSDQF